jgi:hypothetical protein
MRSYGKSNRSPGTATVAEKIRNVGPKSAAWLRQVGVRSNEDVRRLGAVEVYLRVRRAGFKSTLNLLYALGGAEDDCHWQDLSEERRRALVMAVEAAELADPRLVQRRPGRSSSSTLGEKLVAQALGSVEDAPPPADTES